MPRTGLDAALERHAGAVLIGVGAAATGLAFACRFVQDDAFIAFHYARSLVEGHGLTWFGARIEGYTDPLWVLWIAAGLRLGAEPVAWAWLGGLVAWAVTLWATARLALRLFGRAVPALLALLLLATNFSVLAYATGGLETMAQTAFVAVAALCAERLARGAGRATRLALGFSFAAAVAVLTRPDSALPVAVLAAWAGRGLGRRRAGDADGEAGARAWLALALPFAILVGGWLAWKVSYYGQLLPNTYYAKSGATAALLANGVTYVGRFLHAYVLWPFLLAGAPAFALARRRPPAWVLPIGLLVVTWLAYVVAVGGDFMEFRFLVPVAPALFLLVASAVCDGIAPLVRVPPAGAAAATVAVLALASFHHARTFRTITDDRTLDSIPYLATFYGLYPDGNFRDVGSALGEDLRGTDALLAMQAVGAVPYYSRCRTVDQLGLVDPEVARHGLRSDPLYRRPGHQRRAPLAYLRRRGVNLVLGHPTLVDLAVFGDPAAGPLRGQLAGDWMTGTLDFELGAAAGEVTLVLLPVRPGEGLVAWYLTPTPALDARLRERGWPVWRFVLARRPGEGGGS